MIKTLKIHPDTLYEMPYLDYSLNTDDYEAPEWKVKGEYRHKKGVNVLTTKGHQIIFESCFDNAVRLRITKAGVPLEKTVTERLGLIQTTWEETGYDYQNDEGVLKFSNPSMSVTFDLNTNEFTFKTKDGKTLLQTKNGGARFSKQPADYSGLRSYTEFERIEGERYSGFGARMFATDRTGTSADIFSEKGGVRHGDYGGFPVPYFLSSRGYGFFFNNPWPHVYFDMAKSDEKEWFLNAPGGDYDLFVFCGSTTEITKSYTAIVGRNQLPKKWLMGYWCSSLLFDEAKQAIIDTARMREEGYPCDAIVIDGPWRGGKNFVKDYSSGWGYPSDDYNWHPDFGDGVGMMKTLMEKNIKTVLHINSCAFKPTTAVPAIAQGLLRQVGTEVVPDVVTERGLAYYKTFLEPRIKEGCTQWWTDHADRLSGEIASGIPSRNLFGPLWNRAISQTMSEHGIESHMALSRGGGIGSQRYALPWAGDTQYGIKRFQEDIWYILNAGMAGFTLCGYDLGGFTPDPEKEIDPNAMQFEINNVCRRFCQSMIFCPMPRMHGAEKGLPKWPWNCPEETRDLYRECLKYRYRLIPTVYSYAINGAKTGEPIIRPMFYNDMENLALYSLNDQFYMGDYILIAPITEADVEERAVYLPAGKWVNMWTKEGFTGEQTIVCEAPMLKKEGLPMFVKVGGGVAYQPDCMSLHDDLPESLRVELYLDTEAEITLHESGTVVNKFACKKTESGLEIFAENNSEIDRQYTLVVYVDGKEYMQQLDAKAHTNTLYRSEMND